MNRAQNRGSRAAEWYAAGLFFAYAVVLFAHREAPSLTDYANWTYQGVLLKQHLLGMADAAHRLKHYPVPNSAATLGVGVLALALPWMIAAKAWLCVQLLISFVALRHLSQSLGSWDGQPATAAWLILPAAVFLNLNLWWGFVNFQLGLCWVLLTASLLLRRVREAEGKSDWVLGAVLLLAFFTHMIPFAFAGLLVMLYAAQERRLRVLWQLVPSAVVSVWYLAARFLVEGNADGQAGMVATVRSYSAAFWAYKGNSYLKSFGFVNPAYPEGSVDVALMGRAVFAALFVVNVVLCSTMGWRMAHAGWKALRERGGERFLWWGIVLLVPVYVVAPGAALGVSDPGSRVLQAVLALALALAARGGGWALRIAAGCSVTLAVAGLLLFARVGFGPEPGVSAGAPLPHAVASFAHAPNDDQNYFYTALERGDMGLKVFPTGMFLNTR